MRRPAELICPLSSGAGEVQPVGSKGWFCFLLCLFLSPLAGKVPGRAAQGGSMQSTPQEGLSGGYNCPPHSQVSITSEDTALRAHPQGPQGQTARFTSLLIQDSSSRALGAPAGARRLRLQR